MAYQTLPAVGLARAVRVEAGPMRIDPKAADSGMALSAVCLGMTSHAPLQSHPGRRPVSEHPISGPVVKRCVGRPDGCESDTLVTLPTKQLGRVARRTVRLVPIRGRGMYFEEVSLVKYGYVRAVVAGDAGLFYMAPQTGGLARGRL